VTVTGGDRRRVEWVAADADGAFVTARTLGDGETAAIEIVDRWGNHSGGVPVTITG
jgi:hypothetical protein